MTADIDAVLSRLRERPECRDAVEVIERLTAERDRLREACFEASKRLYGSLARHRDLDLDLVSYRHLMEASTTLNVALDAALSEQTERWLERANADAQPGPKHAAPSRPRESMIVDEVLAWIADGRTIQVWDPKIEGWTLATRQDRGSVRYWIDLGGAFRIAPSHPTGEERTDGD